MKIFLILFLGTFTSFCQVKEPTVAYSEKTTKNYVLNRIKTKKMYIYDCDKDGKKKEESKQLREFTQYDEVGNTLRQEVNYFGTKFIVEYKYDNKSNLLESKHFQNNKLTSIERHKYDENGQEIMSYSYDSNDKLLNSRKKPKIDGNYKISFDENGKISTKTYSFFDSTTRIYISQLLTPTDAINYENKYMLGKDDLILEWYVTDNIQKQKLFTTYKYDSNKNRIIEETFLLPKKKIQEVQNSYDSNNLLIESKVFDENSKLTQQIKYQYERF